jgi:hypothetical protein
MVWAQDPGKATDQLQTPDTSTPTAPAQPVKTEGLLSRWLDLDILSASIRYRNVQDTIGVHTFDYGQHRELAQGRFKLDREGKYSINFRASSGRSFNWSYADAIGGQFDDSLPLLGPRRPISIDIELGQAFRYEPTALAYAVGIQSRGGYINLRQLYLSASPIDHVTFEFGSLPIEHGENTEITTYDDDGYMSGERVRIHDPKHLYFDEIDGTFGYLGDPGIPNFFARAGRLTDNNYKQYMVRKKFGFVSASADYSHLRATHTMREALNANLSNLHFIDSARLEMYQRLNDVNLYGYNMPAASGFGVSGTKRLRNRYQLELGYETVDTNYTVYSGSLFLNAVGFSWNSDSFLTSNHAYARASIKLAPGLSLFGFYAQEVSPAFYIDNHHSLNGGINLDMAELLHRARIL